MSAPGTKSPAKRLLNRLDGVRQTAALKYVARCPAHDDKSPSLSLHDLEDRVLIHCFAGCGPGEVLSAVGLTLSDLFVRHETHRPTPSRNRWDARILLKLLRAESEVVLMAANDTAKGRTLNTEDYGRLCLAIERIAGIAEVAS